jgi:predicted permease
MARLLGGDHQVSASIISVQTVLAAATIPIVLIFLG